MFDRIYKVTLLEMLIYMLVHAHFYFHLYNQKMDSLIPRNSHGVFVYYQTLVAAVLQHIYLRTSRS